MPTTPPQLASTSRKGLWGRLCGFIEGDYINRQACDRAFDRMHRRDPRGDRVHLILGVAALLFLLGPVTVTEIAILPLVLCFLLRASSTFPVWIHGFGQPFILATLGVIAWMAVSLLWSPDRVQGLDEMARLRWLVAMGFFFPIIEHRRTLVHALCIGIALGQIGQVLDAFDGFGIGPVAELVENHPGRIAGWWHPVIAGDILVAAMGLHLPAAVIGRGRTRAAGIVGLCISAAGLLVTGTRGAWGAGVLLLVLGVLVVVRFHRVPMRRVLIALIAGLLVSGVVGFVLRDSIRIRIEETRAELREIEAAEYDSYSGRRLRMAQAAVEAFRTHPVAGVGAGGFERFCERQGQRYGAHAHNSTLHTLATLGLVGLGLWCLVLIVALRNAWRWGRANPSHPYELGPVLGIAGLMLASITDCVHINSQSVALLGALTALCPAYAPGGRSGGGDDTGLSAE